MPIQIVTIRDSLLSAFSVFLNFIPTLIGGLIVLAIGWVFATWVARLVERILVAVKLDHATERTGLGRLMVGPHGHFNASYGVAFLCKWFIRLLFIQAVANLYQMPQVTAILNSILLLIPNLAVAFVIVIAGLYLGQFVSAVVSESAAKAGMSRPGVIAMICRYGVVGFSIIAALNHVGIAAVAVNILYIGFVASLALALGLAFGLGGQSVAAEMTRGWYDQNKPTRLSAVPIREAQNIRNAQNANDSLNKNQINSLPSEPDRPAAIF